MKLKIKLKMIAKIKIKNLTGVGQNPPQHNKER